ncbi:MAG: TetR/AcrR family transcriptional regulator [Mycobacteriaceae bacterium]|nr:TetR/AcrR family transcriptional regulator [Mycobacteriaceae bacterium]
MPRVIKHPDVRRAEMLDRAMALFIQHGYDNVSLNDVIANARVSKGAFYHWFPSKDALIAALAEHSAREQVIALQAAVDECVGDALERLNALLQAGYDVKVQTGTPEQLAAMVSLLRPENAHVYGRIVAAGEDLLRPLLTQVISEGVADGVFDTFDPQGVGDMIQALAARTNAQLVDVVDAADESARQAAIDVLTTRFRLHGLAVDRVLGLRDGSITVLTRAQVETLVAALPRRQPGA